MQNAIVCRDSYGTYILEAGNKGESAKRVEIYQRLLRDSAVEQIKIADEDMDNIENDAYKFNDTYG